MIKAFQYGSQDRESGVIIRLLFLPSFLSMTGGRPWKWRAINIPFQIVTGSKLQGDVDLLYAVYKSEELHEDSLIYRAYEIKISLIDKTGRGKSMKLQESQLKKIKAQLEKTIKAGSSQTFFLDLFLFETSYFNNLLFPPKEMENALKIKQGFFKNHNFGHDAVSIEYLENINEYSATKAHPIIHVQTAKEFKTSGIFIPFTKIINDYYETEVKDPFAIITFCKNCNKLTWFTHEEAINEHILICKNCLQFLLPDLI